MPCPRGLTDVAGSLAMPRNAGANKAARASVNRISQGGIGRNALASITASILLIDRALLGPSPRHTGGAA